MSVIGVSELDCLKGVFDGLYIYCKRLVLVSLSFVFLFVFSKLRDAKYFGSYNILSSKSLRVSVLL